MIGTRGARGPWFTGIGVNRLCELEKANLICSVAPACTYVYRSMALYFDIPLVTPVLF
jgi:hypothetical protein